MNPKPWLKRIIALKWNPPGKRRRSPNSRSTQVKQDALPKNIEKGDWKNNIDVPSHEDLVILCTSEYYIIGAFK